MKFTLSLVILALATAQAFSSVTVTRMMTKALLRNFPVEVTQCPDSPGTSLVNFTAFTDTATTPGKTVAIGMDSTAIEDLAFAQVKVTVTKEGMSDELFKKVVKFDQKAEAGGNVHWDFSYYIPKIIPDGTYIMRIEYMIDDATVSGCG